MNLSLFITISLAEVLSLIFIIKLWRGNENLSFKIIGTIIGLIPFLGFFLLLFIFSPQPQPKSLQNRGARGNYTDNFSTIKNILKTQGSVQNVKENKDKT